MEKVVTNEIRDASRDLKQIMLNEIIQPERQVLCDFTYVKPSNKISQQTIEQ